MDKLNQYLILFCLYVGYMNHTYSRRSFQNVINYTRNENFMNTESIGLIVSFQQIGYTMSKFVQPFVIDRVNPKIFFSMTMFVTCLCLFPFAYAKSFYEFTSLYWTHGFFLAFAWPSLAIILKQMIKHKEFGFWWSVQCTSSNLGAVFGAIISVFISDRYGWRMSILFCALINLVCAILISLIFVIINIPMSHLDAKIQEKLKNHSLTYISYLINPILLSNNFMFFCTYVCRYVISDWYQVHLSNLKFPQYIIAGFLSAMELGGIIGSLGAGIMADYLYINFPDVKNPRLYVIIICGGLTAAVLHMLIFSVDGQTTQLSLSSMGFSFGLFIYGPVAVSGIVALEGAPPDQQGMSFGINIIYANVAMLFTGYPVSFLAQRYGWKLIFLLSYFSICASTGLLILFRNFSTPIDSLDLSETLMTGSNL